MSETFTPGDRVPTSGLYRLIYSYEVPKEYVLCIRGEHFLASRIGKVRYELVTAAEYLNQHPSLVKKDFQFHY